ncbi:MAG TPA: hypothetical protein VFV33_01935, partial [Gemmatimonadaceae bacterium]|nr:hypothetical protein [Gemmatimonadaceae bacterium]
MRLRTSPSLVAATLILLHAAVAGGRVSAQEGALSVRELRPTVHVVSGFENGNVLVLASDSALLLVDAQSASRVAA